MYRHALLSLPVLLGFAVSLLIVAAAHAEPADVRIAAEPAPVEREFSKIERETGWLTGFQALIRWRIEALFGDDAEGADRHMDEPAGLVQPRPASD